MFSAAGLFVNALRDRHPRYDRACRGERKPCDRSTRHGSSVCRAQLEVKARKALAASRCSIAPGCVLDCKGFQGFQDAWCDKAPVSLHVEARFGGGAFGQVFKATDASKRPVAVKVLDRKAHEVDTFLNVLLWREIGVHKLLDHPNVTRVYGIIQTSKYVLILQELCDSGNVFRFSCKRNRTEAKIKGVVRDILHGLEYCHN